MGKLEFDYKHLPTCEYCVPVSYNADGHDDCGEPAVAVGWWKEDMSDKILLCQEHLDMILQMQNKEKV